MSGELLQVQFQGVDEGSDPKALPPGTLLRAHNVAMDKARRLVKRDGTDQLPANDINGGEITTGVRLIPRGDQLAVSDGEVVYSYDDSLDKWILADRHAPWDVSKRVLADSTRSISALDVALSGDLLVIVYQTVDSAASGLYGGAVFIEVQNVVTGATVKAPTIIFATGDDAYPRVLISGTTAYAFASLAGTIDYQKLDLTTLALGATGSLVADSRVVPSRFSVVIGTPTAGVATLYLAYELAAGASRTRINSFTLSTLASVATGTIAGTSITAASLVFGTLAQRVSLVHSASSNTYLTTFATTLGAASVGPTTLYAGISYFAFVVEESATNLLVGWQTNDATYTLTAAEQLSTRRYTVAAHVEDADARRTTFGIYYPSTPWRTNGRWFLAAVMFTHPYATNTDKLAQKSSVVLEVDTDATWFGGVNLSGAPHTHVATLENQTGQYALHGFDVKAAVDADGVVYIPTPYRNREPDNISTPVPTGFSLYRLEANAGDVLRAAPAGAGALLGGGAPLFWDGISAKPYGFAQAPQIISVTPAAGGAIVAGDYSYVVTYSRRDANGVLHRSIPSFPKTGTTVGANLKLIVKVSTSSLSHKQKDRFASAAAADPVMLEVWRTTIGATGDHYRLTHEPTYSVLLNDPTAGDVSITDDKSDASITGAAPLVALSTQAKLYTDTGELADVPPPSLTSPVAHRGRLAGLGPDLRTVWFSKDSTEDTTVAPGFNEALTLAFSSDKGALASLDEKLVVFGEDTIDVVHGNGPDATGQGNDWSIQRVQSDVGCVNPRSVVTTPFGVVFESTRGLELLDRGLNVTWIGRAAEDTLASFPTITSAVLVAKEEEIRFTCNTTAGTTGRVLAYDYVQKFWFTRSYTRTEVPDQPFADAAVIGGVYHLLSPSGWVLRETTEHKKDDSVTYVETDVILAPISPAGNLAWHRIKDVTIMGTSVTNHDLKISVARNYATTYEQDTTFLAGSTATTIGVLEKARLTMATQKCHAIQVRIQDLTPTSPGTYPVTTGKGLMLEAVAFRVSKRPGVARTAAGQQG